MENVNIKGLAKHDVLRVLYNNSKSQGFHQNTVTEDMDVTDAIMIIEEEGLKFDYLRARVMKVDISGDEFRAWGYDRDNGEGAAERAIATIR